MIEFRNVTIRAGGVVLLDNASMCIEEGEKVLLMGESGSGKSTILLSLLGKYSPVKGEILFKDEPVRGESLQHVRKEIAYVGQEPVLSEATVLRSIELPFTYKANRAQRPSQATIEEKLALVGLPPDILTKGVGEISGGEKQRVAIARALLLGKRVFLVDEVTSALDDTNAEIITRLFAQSDWTVVAVSHAPLFRSLFKKRYLVANGNVFSQGDS